MHVKSELANQDDTFRVNGLICLREVSLNRKSNFSFVCTGLSRTTLEAKPRRLFLSLTHI